MGVYEEIIPYIKKPVISVGAKIGLSFLFNYSFAEAKSTVKTFVRNEGKAVFKSSDLGASLYFNGAASIKTQSNPVSRSSAQTIAIRFKATLLPSSYHTLFSCRGPGIISGKIIFYLRSNREIEVWSWNGSWDVFNTNYFIDLDEVYDIVVSIRNGIKRVAIKLVNNEDVIYLNKNDGLSPVTDDVNIGAGGDDGKSFNFTGYIYHYFHSNKLLDKQQLIKAIRNPYVFFLCPKVHYVPFGTNEGVLILSASDSLAFNLTESVNTLSSILTRADSPTFSVTEALDIFASLTTTDGINLSITESRNLLSAIIGTDMVNASINENLSLINVALQAIDTLNITFAEAVDTIISTSNSSDSLLFAINDFASIFSAIVLTDGLSISLSEIMLLVKSIQATDSLNASINESSPVINLAISVVDSLGLSLTETVLALFSVLNRNDTIDVSLTDISNILSLLNRVDSLDLSSTEAATILNTLNGLEALSLSISDIAIKAAIGALIGKLSAKLKIYPALSGKMRIK